MSVTTSSPWGTPRYVQGGDPDDGIITFAEYLVRKSVEAGIPQVVVQHAPDGVSFQLADALDSKPVDDVTFAVFADAETARDRWNVQARDEAKQQARLGLTVIEAECGHYRVRGYAGWVDDVHHTTEAKAQAAADRLALGVAA